VLTTKFLDKFVLGCGEHARLDIEVVLSDGRLQIQQLKYFPEGFSGGFAATRRKQIKKIL
jgi:hypothetical protein